MEDSIREKAVRKWAALQDLSLARVTNPKLGRGYFLMDWGNVKLVVGGPEATLDQLEEYLRVNAAQLSATPQRKPKRRA